MEDSAVHVALANTWMVCSAIGRYGNGFKSGCMRLGKDVMVITECSQTRLASVGFLSQTLNDVRSHSPGDRSMQAVNQSKVCVLGSAAVLIGAVHNLLFAPTSQKSYRTVNHESERYGQLDVRLV